MSEFTYERAGVSIATADQAKKAMATKLETKNPRVLNKVGAFASLYDGRFPEYDHPVLVLKVEEPGSKQLLAAQHGRLSSIAFDLVNHLLNDVAVMGAKPLAVLDIIICGKLEKDQVLEMVTGMAEACRLQGCDLVGGETSEQPRVIPNGSYILGAAALGVVDKAKIIDGSAIAKGDVVAAVASNGLHTNGFTMVRSLLEKNSALSRETVGKLSFLDAALVPHLCYSSALQAVFASLNLHGLAHITGGGIAGNLIRILPQGLQAHINLASIQIHPIFKPIRRLGKIDDQEMLSTFNLGVGLLAVLDQKDLSPFEEIMRRHGHAVYQCGTIEPGETKVEFFGKISW